MSDGWSEILVIKQACIHSSQLTYKLKEVQNNFVEVFVLNILLCKIMKLQVLLGYVLDTLKKIYIFFPFVEKLYITVNLFIFRGLLVFTFFYGKQLIG